MLQPCQHRCEACGRARHSTVMMFVANNMVNECTVRQHCVCAYQAALDLQSQQITVKPTTRYNLFPHSARDPRRPKLLIPENLYKESWSGPDRVCGKPVATARQRIMCNKLLNLHPSLHKVMWNGHKNLRQCLTAKTPNDSKDVAAQGSFLTSLLACCKCLIGQSWVIPWYGNGNHPPRFLSNWKPNWT